MKNQMDLSAHRHAGAFPAMCLLKAYFFKQHFSRDSGSHWWAFRAQCALTALPLQWDYFLCSAVPSARHRCTRRPQLLTPTLLWQAPQRPSNSSLDFVSLPCRPHSFLKPATEVCSLCSASFFIPTSTSTREFSPKCFLFFFFCCLFWVFFTVPLRPTLSSCWRSVHWPIGDWRVFTLLLLQE